MTAGGSGSPFALPRVTARGWAAASVGVPLALTAFGAYVFKNPGAVMDWFGVEVIDPADQEAFEGGFRWFAAGPIGVAIIAFVYLSFAARRRRRRGSHGI